MNQLLSYWTVDLISLSLFASFGLLYGFVANWRLQRGAGLYFSGLLIIILIQTSPLHFLGMHYLMSAHMTGHIMLLLVCAPLLVIGLPHEPAKRAIKPLTAISLFLNKYPWVGWLTGLGVMWFWHIPAVYDATVSHGYESTQGGMATIPLCTLAGLSGSFSTNLVHIIHPVSLLLAGVGFAWPLAGPIKKRRIHPLSGVLYLFTACVGCSLLGLLITFAPPSLYAHYAQPDYYGLANLIRKEWGLDRATDQQVAGLMMWVPCCFIYLTGALLLLQTWLTGNNESVTAPTRLILEGEQV